MQARTPDAQLPSLLIEDIGTLAVVPPGPLAGAAMREYELLQGVDLLIQDGRIRWFGPAEEAPLTQVDIRLSADGGTVIPGLIDAHTHIPFAGDRSAEFVQRLHGETYLQILESGGGIRVTAKAVRGASLEQLVEVNRARLERLLRNGVTTVECKSGYGLEPQAELKQLHAIRALNHDPDLPMDLVATYMGAHAIPGEFDGRSDEFVDAMSAPDLLREIRHEKLARFADVFCDRGAFTTAQARRYLERCRAAGLQLKVHADELAQIGASRLAAELGAVSADHLECIDDAGLNAMRAAGTIAVVLPGTSFFLGIEHCNARSLIAAGLPVAIATDFNPGSCHIESLPWVMSIACCQLRLTPKEVLAACTANAAAALQLQEDRGAIATGYLADLTILRTATLDEWFYTPGRDLITAVIKRGRVVHQAP